MFLTLDKFGPLRASIGDTAITRDVVRIGSMFTGWGVCEMVVKELSDQWNALHGQNLEFKVLFKISKTYFAKYSMP